MLEKFKFAIPKRPFGAKGTFVWQSNSGEHLQTMDTQINTDPRLVKTPAKPIRGRHDFEEVSSEVSSLSSPAPFSLSARKSPPALSTRRRKGTGLFAESPGPGSAKHADATSSALSKRYSDTVDGILKDGEKDDGQDSLHFEDGRHETASGGLERKSTGSATCFASPKRQLSSESPLASGRITPQRNLGGLFASPVAPRPKHFPTSVVRLPPHSPAKEKLEGESTRRGGSNHKHLPSISIRT